MCLFRYSSIPGLVEVMEQQGELLQVCTRRRMHFSTNLERFFQQIGISNADITRLADIYELCQKHDEYVYFWRCDRTDTPLNCNLISFDQDGTPLHCHRICDDSPYYDLHWSFGTALFGGHLLNNERHKQVALVQEEVAALLGAYRYPQLLWVALGHGVQLESEHLDLLTDRRVVLYPDHDSFVHWQTVAQGHPNVHTTPFFAGKDATSTLVNFIQE